MSDFFRKLELELRAAVERPPRRIPRWTAAARGGGVALVVVALLVLALVPALLVLGGGGGAPDRSAVERRGPKQILPPVGTVIPKGEGAFPRESDSTVVATGRAPVTGPWQLEMYRGTGVKDRQTGEVYEPAGLRCLRIVPLDPPGRMGAGASGYCGAVRGFRRTPGFSRAQHDVRPPRRRRGGQLTRVKEVLVFGRVPERAAAVVITADGGVRIRVEPDEGPKSVPGDFYVIPVRPGLGHARINWTDQDGNEGSRGIALMPPVTDS